MYSPPTGTSFVAFCFVTMPTPYSSILSFTLFFTFLALPRLSGLGSFFLFLFTALLIAFLPPLDLRLAALDLLKHFGLPSPGLESPHFPMRSPFEL